MRKNPTITTSSEDMPGPLEGVDSLPNPIGVSQEALERGNEMPDVNMSPNDGSNPTIADVSAFASGKDVRAYGSSPKSNATPGMPGA